MLSISAIVVLLFLSIFPHAFSAAFDRLVCLPLLSSYYQGLLLLSWIYFVYLQQYVQSVVTTKRMSKIKPADGEGQQNGAENKVNAGMMRKGDEAEGEENRLRQHEEQRRNAGESKGNVATLVGNGAETDPTPRVPVDDRRGTKSATLSNRGEGAAAARVADASAPDEDGNETKIQGRHQDPPQRQSPTPMPSAATGNARDEADTAANSGAEGSLEPNNPNEVDTPSNVPGTPARESHDGHLASGIVGAVATEGVSPPIHSQSPDAVTQHQHQHQQQPPGTTTSVLGMVPDKEDDDDVKLGRARAPPRRHMLQNYASRDSGAVMLESSPGSKGMSNLLVSSKDKYAISPCEDKQWAVLGLSEDILVRTIRISSHEKYSSLVKEFQVRTPRLLEQVNQYIFALFSKSAF